MNVNLTCHDGDTAMRLSEFVKADEAARTPVPPALYDVIREAAASNQTSFAWSEVQVLLDAVFCEVRSRWC